MFKCKLVAAIVIVVVLLPLAIFAQTGQIQGHVTDQNSSEPLPDVNIVVKGTHFGGSTDNRGYFVVKKIPVGKYIVQVSRIGYKAIEQEIQIASGRIETLTVPLLAEAVRFSEVLVTATREKALKSEVTVAADIITRSEWEQTNAQNIGEILESTTHSFVKNYGHLGALKTVSIRGASENQVLILLDGQRLNLAQGTATNLGDIPLHAIDRIEVVRGGHSALYGTDAIGGVINLITRSGYDNKAVTGRITSTIASFDTRIIEANFGQKLGNFNYLAAHEYSESDGEFKYLDSNRQKVKRTNNNVKWNNTFVKLGYTFNPSTLINGYVQIHGAERGAPGPLSYPSNAALQKDNSKKFNMSFEKHFSSQLNLEVKSFFYKNNQSFDDSTAFIPIHSNHRNNAFGYSLQSNWRLSSSQELTGGYEFREDKINSTDILSHRRRSQSVFLQDQIKLPVPDDGANSRLSLVPAFRLDKFTDRDVQFSPKIGFQFSYITNLQMVLRGNWGSSYRIPSFNELYWPFDGYTEGNPALFPEESLGYDFGFLLYYKRAGYWGLEVNYFKNSIDNLINWAQREDEVWTPKNISKATINGLETKLSYQGLGELINFSAQYGYLNAVDNSTKKNQLIYRPKHKADLKLNIRFSEFNLFWFFQYVGKRFTSSDNTNSLDAYSLNNVGVLWQHPLIGGTIKVNLELRNIFDKQIQIIDGFPVSGREYRVTTGFEF